MMNSTQNIPGCTDYGIVGLVFSYLECAYTSDWSYPNVSARWQVLVHILLLRNPKQAMDQARNSSSLMKCK